MVVLFLIKSKTRKRKYCRVMNIITSAKSFQNHARYLKNLAKSCKKLCKIHLLHVHSRGVHCKTITTHTVNYHLLLLDNKKN